jgi:hypothetical protein
MLWFLATACVRSVRVDAEAAGAAPEMAIPLPGLTDLACAETCRALVRGTLVSVPSGERLGAPGERWDTLLANGESWQVQGPCPLPQAGRCEADLDGGGTAGSPRPLASNPAPLDSGSTSFADAATQFTAAWNAGIAAGWRSGFYRVILGPGGGRITWLRGIDGAGQLIRAGAGTRTVRLGAANATASWPAWLALHPTGLEAYLVAWPSPAVRAFDPATLEPRWTVTVEGAAQGLFVDPGGRWLVAGVGSAMTERFVDWDVPAPAQADSDPTRDEKIRSIERPPMSEVVVIDIATKSVVGRASGTFRRFIGGPRPVLATDREILFLNPGAPPS